MPLPFLFHRICSLIYYISKSCFYIYLFLHFLSFNAFSHNLWSLCYATFAVFLSIFKCIIQFPVIYCHLLVHPIISDTRYFSCSFPRNLHFSHASPFTPFPPSPSIVWLASETCVLLISRTSTVYSGIITRTSSLTLFHWFMQTVLTPLSKKELQSYIIILSLPLFSMKFSVDTVMERNSTSYTYSGITISL